MGIAQRTISTPYSQELRWQRLPNPLTMNSQTIGAWIQTKRIELNLTPGQLARKMGIASLLVNTWEDGTEEPNRQQLTIMSKVFRTVVGAVAKGGLSAVSDHRKNW